MTLPTPGRTRIRSLTINGQDITQLVREFSIFESLFNPYISAQVSIIDSTNLINNMQIKGNETVNIVFDIWYGRVYEITLKVLSLSNETQTQALRAQSYQLNCVSDVYLNNQTQRVQRAFRNITGTDAIQQLHSLIGGGAMNISPSRGFIGEQEAYIVSNQQVWNAIQDIRTRITHDQYRTGAYTYFHDNSGFVLKPLEQLFAELSPTEYFTNDATMGKSWLDAHRQGRNLLGVSSGASFTKGGRFSIADILRTQGQAQIASFNAMSATYNAGQAQTPSGGTTAGTMPNLGGAISGGISMLNMFSHDPKLEQFSKMIEKAASEQRFIHSVQGGPAYTIQVMIDSGINCTVGKGVYVELAQPIGDMNQSYGFNTAGGNMLVVNLHHNIKNYDTNPQGTTIMELAKGGFNT